MTVVVVKWGTGVGGVGLVVGHEDVRCSPEIYKNYSLVTHVDAETM